MAEPIMYIPNRQEFRNGYAVYNQQEPRGNIYFEALEMVNTHWGNAEEMAGGISKLIRGWNRFYSNFDHDALVACLIKNMDLLTDIRNRDIFSLVEADREVVVAIFEQFTSALKRKRDGVLSPVSTAKTLSLMAPAILPLWDSSIASNYQCYYISIYSAEPYFQFCCSMREFAAHVREYVPSPDDRALLKRIDEYNYSKYTMRWI